MSLAAIKRRMTPSTRVALTHWHGHGPGETIRWGDGTLTLPAERTIARAQTNGVAFWFNDTPGDVRMSWLYWPKAAHVRADGDAFEILDERNGDVRMRYEIRS